VPPPLSDAAIVPPAPDAASLPEPLTGAWQVVPTGLAGPLYGVFARSPDEVYIAGTRSLRVADGTLQTWATTLPWAQLRAVDGDDDTLVVLEGASGIARFHGGAWTRRPQLLRGNVFDSVRLVSHPNEVDRTVSVGAVGIAATQGFDGVTSLYFSLSCDFYEWYTPHCTFAAAYSPGAAAPDEIWLLGETAIQHTILDVQTNLHSPPMESHPGVATAVHGLDVETLTAVGPDGMTHRRTRAGWVDEQLPGGPELRDVWMGAANDIWAVGAAGAAWHFDGRTWTPVPTGVAETLRGVWGAGGVVWAVGDAGTVLRFAEPDRPLPVTDIQPAPAGVGPSFVRFVLANDGAVQLTCTTGNTQVGPPLDGVGREGGEIGHGYETLAPGDYEYWVYPFGFQGCLGVGQGQIERVALGPGEAHTLVETGSLATPFHVLTDDPTPAAEPSDARVRVHHAADDAADELAPALDFCVGAWPLAAHLGAGETSPYAELPSGQQRFEVRVASPEAPCTGALLRQGLLRLGAGETDTLVFGQGARNPGLPLSVHFRVCADGVFGVPPGDAVCVTAPLFPPLP
jgi:hypothetical protein